MKKQIMMMAALFVALGAVNAQHNHGSHGAKEGSKATHSKMKMESKQIATYDVSADFQKQLTVVYNASLLLTENLIAGEMAGVSNSGSQIKATLVKVDMSLLESSEAHMEWMMNLKVMNTALDKISTSASLKDQRTAYASFNVALYKSLKAFGTTAGTVYYQHCPMAMDNQGGYWLSDNKEIRNPFLGQAMLTCGSTKDTIN